jgi:hypothetical protein
MAVCFIAALLQKEPAGGQSSQPEAVSLSAEARDSILKAVDEKLAPFEKRGVASGVQQDGFKLAVTVTPAYYELSFAQKSTFAELLALKYGKGERYPFISFRDHYTGREVGSLMGTHFKM